MQFALQKKAKVRQRQEGFSTKIYFHVLFMIFSFSENSERPWRSQFSKISLYGRVPLKKYPEIFAF